MLKPMQRRVQRPVLDLQQVIHSPLNVFRDLMSVGGAEQKCPQNQHVERALQQLDSAGRFFWHR
jgi:hypothetical protein